MPGGARKPMVDISISLPTVEVGGASYASGIREKKIYSQGFDAAVNLVMEYWKKGEDIEEAEKNIGFIKEMLFNNKTWGTEEKK
jgi:hypothetical protein